MPTLSYRFKKPCSIQYLAKSFIIWSRFIYEKPPKRSWSNVNKRQPPFFREAFFMLALWLYEIMYSLITFHVMTLSVFKNLSKNGTVSFILEKWFKALIVIKIFIVKVFRTEQWTSGVFLCVACLLLTDSACF